MRDDHDRNERNTMRERNGRKRTNERATIMVEALIVLSVMVVLFAAGAFLNTAYALKFNAFGEAAASAWQQAENGCSAPLGGSYSVDALLAKEASSPSLTDPDPAFLGGVNKGPLVTRMHTAITPTPIEGPRSRTYSATAQILCNEVPLSRDQAWN